MIYATYACVKVNSIQSDTCFSSVHMAVALFWNEFFDWWSQVTSENIQLPDSTILYGPTNPLKHHQLLSLALLVTKYFIYKCNLNEQSLLFSLFKIQLRENVMTERYIAIKNQNCQAL